MTTRHLGTRRRVTAACMLVVIIIVALMALDYIALRC